MTGHEQPTEGGSYLRSADGKLTRIDEASPAETPAAAAKAGKTTPAKPKAEK